NGETKTGVTTFFIDEKIDTGAIILSKETPIDPTENAGSLHDRLMALGSTLVIDTVKLIENGAVETQPQPVIEHPKTAYKLNKDNCKLDFNLGIDALYNQIRGLSPYPAAWCTLVNDEDRMDIKIYASEKDPCQHHTAYGSLIQDKNTLKVAVKGGFLWLEEIQLPGKRKMDVKSLLNGFQLKTGAKLV
ncbi:MAG: methionyl-tRNA formyltransferase, partial [Mangrovimonas sp.]|nr:methionyl-tRNA formyltransferase [Mangrovimonas sp.]